MGDLAKRCQEILDWKHSGLLVDGELRKLAAALENVPDTYRLLVAENQTATEAMQEIVRLAAKPSDEGVRIVWVSRDYKKRLDFTRVWEKEPSAEVKRGFEQSRWKIVAVEVREIALSTTGEPKR